MSAAAAAGSFTRLAEAAQPRPVVVELFTSQGCSSCPPADELLAEIRSMPGIFAVSLNVDYWDYLGWRDTLADKSHSQRQYDYAHARGDMDVYTPQIIVDGGSHYVGSSRSQVLAAIDRAQAAKAANPVDMTVTMDGEEIVITAGKAGNIPECTIWLMTIAPKFSVEIERGENAGRTIDYYNVVRKLVPATMWKGEATTARLPKTVMSAECTACVALLQQGNVGPVKAAAAWGILAS